MKRLIVTADDLGLHRGMNLGALRAHREGIVTACSLVANGRELDHAIELLRDAPDLDAGVHLTFVEETPLLPVREVSSLVDANGRFFKNHRRFLIRYFTDYIRVAELERELRAQIERILASGLRVWHLNGHQHLHVLPEIYEMVARLAEEYRVTYIRIPGDRKPRASLARRLSMHGLSYFARFARDVNADAITNDATIGVAAAGHLDVERLIAMLGDVDGLTELVVHPGVGDIASVYDWGYEWERETEALCDARVREAVEREGIVLTRIAELAR